MVSLRKVEVAHIADIRPRPLVVDLELDGFVIHAMVEALERIRERAEERGEGRERREGSKEERMKDNASH